MATKKNEGFSAEERAAMRERAAELKRGKNKAEAEADLREKIAALAEPDRVLAERLAVLVRENAPHLDAKTYYGMPAWAKDGKVLVFLQPAEKFKTRYATLGFNDVATLDDGDMWPTAYALTTLTPELEDRIAGLLTRAAG